MVTPPTNTLYGVGAGTAAAAFRGEHQALRRNNPQPAATADAFQLGFLVGLDIPHTMKVVAEKNAVIARSHITAATAFRDFDGQDFFATQIECPAV